jgi:hypothetical protein
MLYFSDRVGGMWLLDQKVKPALKGTVQRKLRWVKIGINQ